MKSPRPFCLNDLKDKNWPGKSFARLNSKSFQQLSLITCKGKVWGVLSSLRYMQTFKKRNKIFNCEILIFPNDWTNPQFIPV